MRNVPISFQSRMGRSAPSLTRSRRSLPGLKCGTYLPDSATASPVLGLRPCRGGRKCSENEPKPRISMRSPADRASLMISRICLSASSTSLAGRCFCFAVMISMSSDFVMGRYRFLLLDQLSAKHSAIAANLLLQQVAEAGARRGLLGAVIGHRLLLLVDLLGLDRQRNRARLAIHAREAGFHFLADLQHRARVLDAIAAQLAGAQLAFDAVAEVDDRATRVHFLDEALDDGALRIVGDVLAERVLRELLDAQRDAFTFRIDGQHHGLHLLALLVVAHGFFAGHVP